MVKTSKNPLELFLEQSVSSNLFVDRLTSNPREFLSLARTGPSVLGLPSFLEKEHGPTRQNLIRELYNQTDPTKSTAERYAGAVETFHWLTRVPMYDWDGLRDTLRSFRSMRHVTAVAEAPRYEPAQAMTGVSKGIHPVRDPRVLDSQSELRDNPTKKDQP